MGKRGEASPASALHLVRNDGDGPDSGDGQAPAPEESVTVDPPAWLSDKVRAQWEDLAPHLPEPLTPADVPAFAALCVALVSYQEACEAIDGPDGAGLLITNSREDVVPNPALRIRDQQDAIVAKWSARFGLTPDVRRQLRPGAAAPSGPRGIPHLVEP